MKFFENLETRPSPLKMLDFVKKGGEITDLENQWQKLGYRVPQYQQTLAELDITLPYFVDYHRSILRRAGGGDKIIYAGRDAEVLYDIAVLRREIEGEQKQPNLTLLPASSPLIREIISSNQSDKKAFLEFAGIKIDTFEGNKKVYFIDSGFRGSIGSAISSVIQDVFGDMLCHKLSISENFKSLLSFKLEDINFRSEEIRLSRELDDELSSLPRVSPITFRKDPLKYKLAVAMQIMPRYNDTYTSYRITDGQFQVLPARIKNYTNDCDNPERINDNVFNPFAAMATMHHLTTKLLTQSN